MGESSAENNARWGAGKTAGFLIGVLFFALFETGALGGALEPAARKVAGVAILMASWWISQCISIPATSLLPIALFPLLGVMKTGETTAHYAHPNIFLFLGGFIIALGMQKWSLHKRIALHIVALAGASPRRLVLGFMAATAFLSMWISNTATAMMMFPIGLAVVAESDRLRSGGDRDALAPAMMLCIAYAASIGGIATPIGTPPNIVFMGQFQEAFPNAPAISFFDWFKVFFPLVLVLCPVVWALLVYVIFPTGGGGGAHIGAIREEIKKLGPLSRPELYTLAVFAATGALWMFREDINLEILAIPGWSRLLPEGARGMMDDAAVAITMALVMFLIPVDRKKGQMLMDWETAVRLPWGIILLFGGGFALAGGFKASGLDKAVGQVLEPLLHASPLVVVAVLCLFTTFLTEVTSNTATTAALLPIMSGIALATGMNPLLFMLPTTISASCAFMLPVATPPNAIVFGSGRVTMGQMARAGIIINLAAAAIIVAAIFLIAVPAYHIGLSGLPSWAVK